jgi:hypothetical protein
LRDENNLNDNEVKDIEKNMLVYKSVQYVKEYYKSMR